jgi:betaine-aldehyde dehydrogenase
VIDEANCTRLEGLVHLAQAEGNMILRGSRVGTEGTFLSPTLVGVEDLGSRLVQEELFGPIATFETFGDETEALFKAHATDFGLAASVHTRDLTLAHRMARRLKAGTVWLNCHRRQFAEIEVGGFGESGLGRLHGTEALDDFLQTKHVFLEYEGTAS